MASLDPLPPQEPTLWVKYTVDPSRVTVGDWSAASPECVVVSDRTTSPVVESIRSRPLLATATNELAHQRLTASGQLGGPSVSVAAREYAIGEQVVFVTKHVEQVPRLGPDGEVLHRQDGTPRLHALPTPRRARGEVVGIDLTAAEGVQITVRTDQDGRLSSRLVHLSADQAARELDRGYAMTTAGSQGKSWGTTYGIWTGSRLTGLEQGYTATSRAREATIDYLNGESVQAEASPDAALEEDTVARMAALISRSTAKSTTLDVSAASERLKTPSGPFPLRTPHAKDNVTSEVTSDPVAIGSARTVSRADVDALSEGGEAVERHKVLEQIARGYDAAIPADEPGASGIAAPHPAASEDDEEWEEYLAFEAAVEDAPTAHQ